MPLKKPKDLPKLPKTRKKKAHAAIDAIPEKKPDKIEYKVSTFFHYDKTKKKQFVIIRIETVAEFTSFAYEVSIGELKEKRDYFIVLMGLKAKTNMVPGVQPARTDLLLEDLVGEYTFHIVKQDGAINSAVFNFNPFKKEIKLVEEFLPEKKNNRHFCKFSIAEDLFSFS